MKTKTIVLIIIAVIVSLLVSKKSENVLIPKDAIRIRIIANSNTDIDIEDKMKVRDTALKEIYKLLEDVKSLDDAKKIINNNLDRLNIKIDETTEYSHTLSFGNNYFPRKTYKGIVYDEGEYESLVITLGSGKGSNFWCVLFPPLCNLEGNTNTKDVEYQFFVKKIIDKYF